MRRLGTMAIAALLVAGCGAAAENIAEEAIEQAAEQSGGAADVEFDVDAETGEVNVSGQTEEGDLNYSVGGGEIPDGFTIPVMDGGEVLSSASQESGDTAAYAVSLQFPRDSYEDVVAYYEDYVSSLDGDTQRSETSGSGLTSTQWVNNGSEVLISVTQTDDATNVALNQGFG